MTGGGPEGSDQPDPPHITETIRVQGILRLGADIVCEGSIFAPGGVILGEGVLVEGDIYTDGPVELGRGARIEGRVNPKDPSQASPQPTASPDDARRPEPAEQADRQAIIIPSKAPTRASGEPPMAASDENQELGAAALRSTLQVLLNLVSATAPTVPSEQPEARWEIEEGALEDLAEGAYELIVDVHRDGKIQRPWGRNEVVDILLCQVIPVIVPVSVDLHAPDEAHVRIQRPSPDMREIDSMAYWPTSVLALISLLGETVRPDLEVERIDDVSSQDPREITARIRL